MHLLLPVKQAFINLNLYDMNVAVNSTNSYKFTITIPVYNEEDNIYMVEDKLKSFLSIILALK